MKTFRRKRWLHEEVQLLRAWYAKLGAKGCKALIPRHNHTSIKVKASQLNLTNPPRTQVVGAPW